MNLIIIVVPSFITFDEAQDTQEHWWKQESK